MARLPRFRWPKPASLDPVLVPLVLDGYGFHQAYFHTAPYVDEQYQDPNFPWPGGAARVATPTTPSTRASAAPLWFIGGTDPDRVADLIDAFPEARRGDLYSGVGLAATYAGGVEERRSWRTLYAPGRRRTAATSRRGRAFAADARVRAGHRAAAHRARHRRCCAA